MSQPSSRLPTLAHALWTEDAAAVWLRRLTLVAVGVVAMWISAKIEIPFYPVPLTMQTFVALVIGAAYGSRLGASTIATYLALGAAGVPLFAGTPEKGIGLAYLMGPTGGYLIGFMVAAAIVGWLAERGFDRSVIGTVTAMILGNLAIYALGLLWLGTLLGWDKPILEWGLTPFLLGDLVKIALAAAVLPLAWKLVKALRGA